MCVRNHVPVSKLLFISTHLLVQKPDYIQDVRYRGDLLLTKMWGAVRTAECELAHLSGHSCAETWGQNWQWNLQHSSSGERKQMLIH